MTYFHFHLVPAMCNALAPPDPSMSHTYIVQARNTNTCAYADLLTHSTPASPFWNIGSDVC
jgi:hypothetical protein